MRAPNPAEMKVFKDRMSPEQIAAFDEMTNFELMLHDLERLNILEKKMVYLPGRTVWVETDIAEVPAGHSEGGMKTTYALTQYGVSFHSSCSPETGLLKECLYKRRPSHLDVLSAAHPMGAGALSLVQSRACRLQRA